MKTHKTKDEISFVRVGIGVMAFMIGIVSCIGFYQTMNGEHDTMPGNDVAASFEVDGGVMVVEDPRDAIDELYLYPVE